MRLTRDWKRVLRYAWSVRLIVFAFALDAIAAGLSYVADTSSSPWLVAVAASAAAIVNVLTLVARVLPQKTLPEDV